LKNRLVLIFLLSIVAFSCQHDNPGVIQIKILGVDSYIYTSESRYIRHPCTTVEFSLTNPTDVYVRSLEIGADIYISDGTTDGKYLEHSSTKCTNLQPKGSIVKAMVFENVDTSQVYSLKLYLEKVEIDKSVAEQKEIPRQFRLDRLWWYYYGR